jgi:hypothetical protein
MSDASVVTASNEPYYGCVPYDKTGTVVVQGGYPATVDYEIRDDSGNPVNLSPFFNQNDPGGENDPYGVFVGFALADHSYICRIPQPAQLLDAEQARIQFTLPEFLFSFPCIYRFSVGIADKSKVMQTGEMIYVAPRQGFLVVEWTPFMAHHRRCPVPHAVVPSLRDLRIALDDFVSKNDLLSQVEYSADDLAFALTEPIRQFRETPPNLKKFAMIETVATFPYYHNWLRAACAELLGISVKHYMRNKLLSSHGGITGDEKNRDRDYFQQEFSLKEEYRIFCAQKKLQLNLSQSQGWGTTLSNYAVWNRCRSVWGTWGPCGYFL